MTHPNVYEDVMEFHQAMCPDQIGVIPQLPTSRVAILRSDLIAEEHEELQDAIHNDDLVGVADAAADLIVVVLGTLIAYGIPFNEVWREVHRTNMAKKDGPVRADGKRLKPEGWQPPDIERILIEYGAYPDSI